MQKNITATMRFMQYTSVLFPLSLSGCSGFELTATIMKWEPIANYSTASKLRNAGKPVGKVLVRWDTGHISHCTGTVIAKNLVVTAAHCLKRPQGPQEMFPALTSISIIMGYEYPGEFVKRVTEKGKPKIFSLNIQPVEIMNTEAIDYAVLEALKATGSRGVGASIGDTWGIVRLSKQSITSSGATPLFVVHHPKTLTPKQITRYKCHTYGHRVGHYGKHIQQPMGHNCDTIGGSSGAPLFFSDDYTLAGFHMGVPSVSGIQTEEDSGVTDFIHQPLNVFTVLTDVIAVSSVFQNAYELQDRANKAAPPSLINQADYGEKK